MPKSTKAVKDSDRKKAWFKKSKTSNYNIETREPNKTILIVCEGQTEKLYFESFPVLSLTLKVVDLKGQTKLKLVEATQSIINGGKINYDLTWCIFDMDIKEGAKEYSDFDNAIKKGMDLGYYIGYSNDAFELWFYLHYRFTDQKHHRKYYYQSLSKAWNINYEKDGKKRAFSKLIYHKLLEDSSSSQTDAIKRAKKIYQNQKDLVPHMQNPVTTIYELVEVLNKNMRK